MYRFWKDAVRGIDCDNIIEEYKKLGLSEANVATGDVIGANCSTYAVDKDIRESKVNWLEENNALTRTIWSYITDANKLYFNYELSGHETAQFARYEKDEFYTWHTDSGGASDKSDSVRKISATLQLSKPEDYEGCELQFYKGDKDPDELPKDQGTIVIFNSFDWHRVSPTISGTRYSLVMWARGPRFQ